MAKLSSISDVDLLGAWRQGHAESGNELFERYFSKLYRFFRSKVGDEVEDLIQDTFVACVAGRDRLREDAGFRAYLFAVARNILYREFRRRSTTGDRLDFTTTSLQDLGPTPTTLLAQHGDAALLQRAIEMIPVEYQVAVELYYFEEMTGPELAAALGIPEPSVRSRLRRGLEQLRKAVAELATSGKDLESTMSSLQNWESALGRP